MYPYTLAYSIFIHVHILIRALNKAELQRLDCLINHNLNLKQSMYPYIYTEVRVSSNAGRSKMGSMEGLNLVI